jgi:hypothetical protein
MLTRIERVQSAEIADLLIELYTQRAEACGQEDWHRVRTIEQKIQSQRLFGRVIHGRA